MVDHCDKDLEHHITSLKETLSNLSSRSVSQLAVSLIQGPPLNDVPFLDSILSQLTALKDIDAILAPPALPRTQPGAPQL